MEPPPIEVAACCDDRYVDHAIVMTCSAVPACARSHHAGIRHDPDALLADRRTRLPIRSNRQHNMCRYHTMREHAGLPPVDRRPVNLQRRAERVAKIAIGRP